tara:strand:+ start:2625 stop:2729 length:105 start_codon:yes stop_codon:yes gene_type:complete
MPEEIDDSSMEVSVEETTPPAEEDDATMHVLVEE